MSKLLNQIKQAVKDKNLNEDFKSDDKVSTNPGVEFDKSKSVPTKKDLKKAEEANDVAGKNTKIEAGMDKDKNPNSIVSKKFKQVNELKDEDGNVVDGEDDDNDADTAPKKVAIAKPDDSSDEDETEDEDDDSDDDSKSVDGDQEVDIKVRKVTKEDLDLSEHMAALLGREELTEEFKVRTQNIFETAVVTVANEVIAEAVEELMLKQKAAEEAMLESMVDKLDGFLDKVVSEWLEENRVEVQTNVRTEIAESFLVGLKSLFEEHYIDIAEDKVDIVTEMVERLEALEASLDEEINKNVELANELMESKKDSLVMEHLDGLSDNQKQKMRMMAESIDLTDEDSFVSQLEDIKESYFRTEVKRKGIESDDTAIELNEDTDSTKQHSSVGEAYAAEISKHIRKIR